MESLVAHRWPDFKARAVAALELPARLVFPATCLACRKHVGQAGSLCPECWQRTRFLERPWCEVLGVPFAHDMPAGTISPAAIADPPEFARCRAAVSYVGVARQLVGSLKYRDRTDLAPWLARWMARAGSELLADADVVVPVPLHRARFFTRRYNQSAELARAVARLADRPFQPDLVRRLKATRQQVGLGARERQENVRGAFGVPDKARPRLKGRRVLLVDDVYTTGATVSVAARALKAGGASAVDVLAFARAIPGDFLPDEPRPI